jgi:hypothetical protein
MRRNAVLVFSGVSVSRLAVSSLERSADRVQESARFEVQTLIR